MKLDSLAIVIIGRNEGQRLIDCLNSVSPHESTVIYVDSDSSDDSIVQAEQRDAHIVALDMGKPFTAARARNAGVNLAKQLLTNLRYVQFLDGDCVVNESWIKTAYVFLETHSEVAVVSGRLRERYPEKTVYNQLCDMEWDTPVGEAAACGGIALMRYSVLSEVGGFREGLIAGEEPELCVRMRQYGHKVWRLDAEMGLHDAAMTHFSQWWKRSVRAGYAFAEGAYLHGAAPEYHWVAETRRAWFWAGILPTIALAMLMIKPVLSIVVLLAYPLQVLRMTFKNPKPFKLAAIQAFYAMVGKFAELQGQAKFLCHRYTHKQGKIIEYK